MKFPIEYSNHFIVDKSRNSESQNRDAAEGRTSRFNTIEEQINYHAKDYADAYYEFQEAISRQQPDNSQESPINSPHRNENLRVDDGAGSHARLLSTGATGTVASSGAVVSASGFMATSLADLKTLCSFTWILCKVIWTLSMILFFILGLFINPVNFYIIFVIEFISDIFNIIFHKEELTKNTKKKSHKSYICERSL